jgi:hypothetical protein
MSLDCSAQSLRSIGGGNQLGSHIPRRNNGEEDREEGDEESREEALSFDAPVTGVTSPPSFFCSQPSGAPEAHIARSGATSRTFR